MARIGFDQKIHPCQLQLRTCSMLDPQGIQNNCCLVFDLMNGIIKNYHTADNQFSTSVREYICRDDELKEVYELFTLDAIATFEALPEEEISQYETGYYDCASLRYLLIGGEGQILDGARSRIYTNDPIEIVRKWMIRVSGFNQG